MIERIPAAGSMSFEARADMSRHFIQNAVDPCTGQPYFDVYYGSPVQMAHDWPDFGDLTARYWEASYMIRDMTGRAPANMQQLGDSLLGWMDSEDGLNYRPETLYSINSAELFDQGRTLSALCSAYMAEGDPTIRAAMLGMVDGLIGISEASEGYRSMPGSSYSHGTWNFWTMNSGYFVGPLIRPLVRAGELLGYEPAIHLASDLSRYVVEKAHMFGPNGEFVDHVHSRLATAAGLFACGKVTGNSEWMEIAAKAWEYAREKSGPCGFVPEYLGEHAGQMRCETCSIMDYLDLTLLLALNGDASKWGEAERTLRNHLIESQVSRADWASAGPIVPRDDLTLSDNVPKRMLGGFGGWTAFDYFFGMTPRATEGWLQRDVTPRDLYLEKRRMFQNCCGPAGLRALYLVWSQSAVAQGDRLCVNMLVNRGIPEAAVSVGEAKDGAIELETVLKQTLELDLRVPEWADESKVVTFADGTPMRTIISGGRLRTGALEAGSVVQIRFPCTGTREDFIVQHGNSPHETFSISFIGDSAVDVKRMSGGMTDQERAEASVLHDAYPLYARNAFDVYSAEAFPRSVKASINWF